MKRFISFILCLVITVSLCACSPQLAEAYTIDYNEEEFTYQSQEDLLARIDEQFNIMVTAHLMADAARALGYNEDHIIIQTAKAEYIEAQQLWQDYQNIYNDLIIHWHEKEAEYPVAAYVWNILRQAGYSDITIAGILGNMMVETGGQTLELKWDARGTYYGLCQWSKNYSEVWGASLSEQVQFLLSTISYELNTYGYKYQKGYNYNSFISSIDVKGAALAFAKVYERCSSSSYKTRQKCAIEAYNYFMT